MLDAMYSGYLDDVKIERREYLFDTDKGLELFLAMCGGLDEYRKESYRFGYEAVLRGKKKRAIVYEMLED